MQLLASGCSQPQVQQQPVDAYAQGVADATTCLVCCAGRDGSWLSLGDHPHIPDDSELLGLFEDVAGITFLAQPGASEAAQPEPHDRHARYCLCHSCSPAPHPSSLPHHHVAVCPTYGIQGKSAGTDKAARLPNLDSYPLCCCRSVDSVLLQAPSTHRRTQPCRL